MAGYDSIIISLACLIIIVIQESERISICLNIQSCDETVYSEWTESIAIDDLKETDSTANFFKGQEEMRTWDP